MKATEQFFPVVLFITLHKMILTLSLWLKFYSMAIQMKAIEQYFPVVLFITLHKMILTLSLWLKFYIMAIQKSNVRKSNSIELNPWIEFD